MMAPGRGTAAGSAHLRTPQRTVWGRFAGGWCRNPRLAGLDARHALWGLPSRLVRSALPAVAWGSACPPAARAPPLCVGSLREARRAACGHPCRQAGTVLRRSASRPFGSHRHPVTATPLRCVTAPRRGSTRCASCTQLRCVSVPPRPRLGGACKAGGRAPWALADRAPPPLGVGRWGALKPTTLRCRFSPGGSPVRSRPFGRVFGGSVETLASLTSTCPTHVLAVTPYGRSAMTARFPPGRRVASPQSALESFGLRRQGHGTLEENG